MCMLTLVTKKEQVMACSENILMIDTPKYVLLNGELILSSATAIPVSSRGLMYGDGCFETFRSYQGKFLHFDEHLARLQLGLNYLGMDSFLDAETLLKQIGLLLQKNVLNGIDTAFRVQYVRTGGAGFTPTSNKAEYIITTRALPEPRKNVILKTVETRAIPEVALSRKVKLTNSINYIKAAQEANQLGGDDALMLTIDNMVSETTIANIFWVKGNSVFTPSTSCDLLPGVTRKIALQLLLSMGDVEVVEGEFSLNEVINAEAVFCTNSLREIYTIAQIDNTSFDETHPMVKRLQKNFEVYKTTNLK